MVIVFLIPCLSKKDIIQKLKRLQRSVARTVRGDASHSKTLNVFCAQIGEPQLTMVILSYFVLD